ncbi:MAG: hypothetical protein V4640_01640 [Verrucomicrobiota bacterium]
MNDSEFDDLLKTAKGDFPLPQSFKQGVWHRIESRAVARKSSFSVVEHPWMSALGIAAAAVLGLWLGAITLPETKDARSAYAESISPFIHTSVK